MKRLDHYLEGGIAGILLKQSTQAITRQSFRLKTQTTTNGLTEQPTILPCLGQ